MNDEGNTVRGILIGLAIAVPTWGLLWAIYLLGKLSCA